MRDYPAEPITNPEVVGDTPEARVTKFLDQWRTSRSRSDLIQGLQMGEDAEAILLASDLRALLRIITNR